MAHDYAEVRIAVSNRRREDSRRKNAAIHAVQKGSHPGRAAARKRKRKQDQAEKSRYDVMHDAAREVRNDPRLSERSSSSSRTTI